MPFGSFRKFVFFAFLLIGASPLLFGQENAEEIYGLLDDYLENPTEENLVQLTDFTSSVSDDSRETQMAKSIANCNIGFIQRQQGQIGEAIHYYEKCTHLYLSENLEGYDIIEYGLKPLGNLYTKIQAFSEAEGVIKDYLLLAREQGNSSQEIAAVVNLSTLYHSSGRYNKARKLLEEALKKLPENEQLQLNLAHIYFALDEGEKARDVLKKQLKKGASSSENYQLLAQVYLKEKRYTDAISILEDKLQQQNEKNVMSLRDQAKLRLQLAEVFYVSEDWENAFAQLQQTYSLLIPFYQPEQNYPSKEEVYGDALLMDALDLHAAIAMELEGLQTGLRLYELAQQANDFLYANVFAQDSKLLVQQNTKRRSEKMLAVLVDLFEQDKDQKWVETALKIDAKSKGRTANEVARIKVFLNEESNKNKFVEFSNLQIQLSALHQEIKDHSQENLSSSVLKALHKDYTKVLSAIRLQYKNLQEELNEGEWEELSLENIQAKAAYNQQEIVSYSVGAKAIYQFLIAENGVDFKKLTHTENEYDDLIQNIRDYSYLFESPDRINNDISTFKSLSYTLYQQLEIPKSRKDLLIIPDGILAFVPFQTLLTKRAGETLFEEMPFLLMERSTSYIMSLANYGQQESEVDKDLSVLGVFPVFKGTNQELSYSVDEAKAIESRFSSELLMENKATAKEFLETKEDHDILHFSTHALGGSFQEEAKLLFADREMDLSELYQYYFPTKLVVLSACDTGIGKLVKGEGAMSLARGFQYAGAQNLLFSLWEVNDKSTAQLMELYYENLQKYQSRNYALHQANLAYLMDKEISNVHKSPYYWSAFVYYGQTDLPVQPESSLGTFWWILISILPVILLLYLVVKLRQKNTR